MAGKYEEIETFIKDEYEMQLFEFNSRIISGYLTDMAVDKINNRTEALQECLLKNLQCSKSDVEAATHRFLKKSIRVVKEQLSHLPETLDEIFAIPPHVILPEDITQKVQYTKEDEVQLDREIEQLMIRAKRACLVDTSLRDEIEVQEKMKALEVKHRETLQLVSKDKANEAYCKVNELVKVMDIMKDGKTCIQFPEEICDDCTVSNKFANGVELDCTVSNKFANGVELDCTVSDKFANGVELDCTVSNKFANGVELDCTVSDKFANGVEL